jgi:hypothetical protein
MKPGESPNWFNQVSEELALSVKGKHNPLEFLPMYIRTRVRTSIAASFFVIEKWKKI